MVIHAKGKTLDDCARALVRAFRLSIGGEAAVDVDAMVDAIGTIGRRLTIMIDALDEAASGHSHVIAERLISTVGDAVARRFLTQTGPFRRPTSSGASWPVTLAESQYRGGGG
jgi:hypothetical protein